MIFEVEVVFPHENPKIKTLFMRKVVEPIDENELLQIIEMYLVPEAPDKSARTGADFPGNHFADGHFADDHVLSGLEILSLQHPYSELRASRCRLG